MISGIWIGGFTARSGHPHLKVFREERQRQTFLLVDFSSSMLFGTRVAFKSVIAAQAASLLAWASEKHGDRIGGTVFSNTQHHDVRPQGGHSGVLRFLQALVDIHGQAISSADIPPIPVFSQALDRIVRTCRPGSVIFLLTDFSTLNKTIEAALTHLSLHHDVVAVPIVDPLELEPPPAGYYRISDGTQFFDLDMSRHAIRNAYQDRVTHRHHGYETLCRRLGIALLPLMTDANIPHALQRGLHTFSQAKHRRLWVTHGSSR